MAEIQVGKRFFEAAQWATELHTPPGSRTPSVAQVLGVASLVLGDGGSQREAIAGMIADASRAGTASKREIHMLSPVSCLCLRPCSRSPVNFAQASGVGSGAVACLLENPEGCEACQ